MATHCDTVMPIQVIIRIATKLTGASKIHWHMHAITMVQHMMSPKAHFNMLKTADRIFGYNTLCSWINGMILFVF